MYSTYELCLLLIKFGRTSGLMDKVDVYFAANRLTSDEYSDLASKLTDSEVKTDGV